MLMASGSRTRQRVHLAPKSGAPDSSESGSHEPGLTVSAVATRVVFTIAAESRQLGQLKQHNAHCGVVRRGPSGLRRAARRVSAARLRGPRRAGGGVHLWHRRVRVRHVRDHHFLRGGGTAHIDTADVCCGTPLAGGFGARAAGMEPYGSLQTRGQNQVCC